MQIRNVAIIAHVDHGKTTLVDKLLGQSGAFREHQAVTDRALDRNDLEKERGITILAKCASVVWNDTRINIVDTPGHADFGGEVERILNMVDGAIVLVDAAEGVLPQTKFVVGKALARGIHPIVVVNKVDRQDARPDEVHTEIFDLFAALGASDSQLDFPMLYASGRNGWADETLDGPRKDLSPLFDLVLRHVPAPTVKPDQPFAMVASILEYDNFLGRVLTGRVEQGMGKVNMPVKVLRRDGSVVETGRLTKLLSFRGLERVPVDEVMAGDIIAVAGLSEGTIPDTIGAPELTGPLEAIPVDPPTLAMTFRINDWPAGRPRRQEGHLPPDPRTSVPRGRGQRRHQGHRLERDRRVRGRRPRRTPAGRADRADAPRRLRTDHRPPARADPRNPETGEREEPMEEVLVDVDEPYTGVVVEKLSRRKGDMRDMRPSGGGKVRLTFNIPSRGLIGYHGEFLTDTRGTGIMNRLFAGYGPWKGPIEGRRAGSLISTEAGEAVHYSLFYIQERGTMFVSPGEKVYQGMILGEHSRESDLEVNPIKEKKLTNIRAAGKDDAMLLIPPRKMSLEQAIAYVEDDEFVEVTPAAVRLRKRYLDPNERKRFERKIDAEAAA